jgi:hypothetical protein
MGYTVRNGYFWILPNGRWFVPQDLFSSPPGDDEEPDSSPLPSAAEEDDPGFTGQGLYVCLPPEQLTLAGFAQGGQADTMTPGPLLSTVVHTVTGEDGQGLPGCSDDQLMGIISAARRQAARDEWTVMAAMAEYASHPAAQDVRRAGRRADPPGAPADHRRRDQHPQ